MRAKKEIVTAEWEKEGKEYCKEKRWSMKEIKNMKKEWEEIMKRKRKMQEKKRWEKIRESRFNKR